MMWLIFGLKKPILYPISATRLRVVENHRLDMNTSELFNGTLFVMMSSSAGNSTPSTSSTHDHTLLHTNEPSPRELACRKVQNVHLFKSRRRVMQHSPHIKASCGLLRAGNGLEREKIRSKRKNWTNAVSDRDFLESLHQNCSKVVEEFNEVFYSSQMELQYPLAFEMLIYYKADRIQQYIRLLKFLYRPQNVYCIHIDKKSPIWWKNQITEFASCFPNIIIAKHPVKINYATATILYGHLECLKDLLQSALPWKYVITLHATELPLMTNREMVTQLKALNGSNFINRGIVADSAESQVNKWIHYKVKSINQGKWVQMSDEPLDPVPHGITLYKSGASANSALTRNFVKFMFNNEQVEDLLKWLNDVHSAVEFFFSTVNQMPGAPGHSNITAELAHREWVSQVRKNHYLCVDLKIVHDICIVSAGDLPRLTELSEAKKYWFFNKYFISYDHVVMDCMEELLLQRNVREYERDCE